MSLCLNLHRLVCVNTVEFIISYWKKIGSQLGAIFRMEVMDGGYHAKKVQHLHSKLGGCYELLSHYHSLR